MTRKEMTVDFTQWSQYSGSGDGNRCSGKTVESQFMMLNPGDA